MNDLAPAIEGNLRIALVSPYDWSANGGVRTHIRGLASEFRGLGHTVTIFAPNSRPEEDSDCVPLGPSHAINVVDTTVRISLRWQRKRIQREIRRRCFDIVHVHEPVVPTLPLAFIRYSRAPVVATFHAAREGRHPLYRAAALLARRQLRCLSARIAVSPAARKLVTRYLPGDYQIIPNGLDYDRWATPQPPLPEFMDGRVNILFVGRAEKRKGLDDLLEAYLQIAQDHVPLRLIIVGNGNFDRYGWLAAGRDDIVFRSEVSDDELPRYHYSADIFCCPNTGGESQGLVLMEAMAAGRAIVASDIEGFAAVARDGIDAVFAPPNSPSALAAAISSLAEDAHRRHELGKNARLRASEYRWPLLAGRVLQVYRDVLARPARARRTASPGRTRTDRQRLG